MRKEMLPVCRKLALKKLLQNKGQAVCMMVSVILTTVLFTTAFSAVFYFQDSLRKAALERASWTAHGAVAEVTDAQYQAMQQSSMISDISCYEHLGFLREEVQDEVVEIQYSEDTIAQWMNFGLSWGRMPRDKQEAVLSREFLDSKGIPSDASGQGTPVSLRYEVNGTIRESSFTISGAYEQKPASSEVMFVSQEFFEETLAGVAGEENRDSMLGKRVVEVVFPDTAHLQGKMEQFVEQAGAAGNTWFLNPAYAEDMQIEPGIAAAVAFVLLLIMCCAYFIISNICSISVMQDTRFYGSLAVLGFEKKEIRRIVRIRSNVLCVVSIPPGLVLGLLLVRGFLPKIMQPFFAIDIQDIPGPMMFVSAAVFAFLTVRISSRRPERMASEMQPVKAERYVPVRAGKKKISRNGHKIWVMAWKNVTRERGKSILIACSIMSCIVLASFFYTVSRGLDMDIYLENSIRNDFITGGSSYFNRMEPYASAMDAGLLQTLKKEDGIEQSGGACIRELDIPLDGRAYEKLCEIAGEDYFYEDGVMHNTLVYGLDDYILSQISVIKGTLDLEKFQTGNYIVASSFFQSPEQEGCYEPGDRVKLAVDGRTKEYTVMAVGVLPNDYTVRYRYADSVELYLPSAVWMEQMQAEDYFMYAFDVKEDCRPHWEKLLSEMAGSGRAFAYQSKQTFRKQFEGFSEGFVMLGTSVSVILGIIGLMNFVNVVYSSIYNRRRELAVMQGMGMGIRQVYAMLMEEGSYYMLAAWLGSLVFSLPAGCFLMASLADIRYFQYHFYPQPFLALGLAGCLAAACVPCMIFYALDKKEDLICRLRLDLR